MYNVTVIYPTGNYSPYFIIVFGVPSYFLYNKIISKYYKLTFLDYNDFEKLVDVFSNI